MGGGCLTWGAYKAGAAQGLHIPFAVKHNFLYHPSPYPQTKATFRNGGQHEWGINLGDVQSFLGDISRTYASGNATEHSYRAAIEHFVQSFDDTATVQNEPQRLRDVGAPDFSVHRDVMPVGYIEAKDIGVDLRPRKGSNKDQQDRYRKALPNLIYTDGLLWDFYRNGDRINSVRIAALGMDIQPRPDQFDALINAIEDFLAQTPQAITSSQTLAEIMARKAQLIKDILFNALATGRAWPEKTAKLSISMRPSKISLSTTSRLHEFADVYAETVAYGFFAARLHDTDQQTFTRHEALDLLPKTNPFLRNLFTYICGPDLDDRLKVGG